MSQILQEGGEHDGAAEPIDTWLACLTNPKNLWPGLPDLTVYFGDAQLWCIHVSFDRIQPSLRSLKLELPYASDDDMRAFCVETDPQMSSILTTDMGPLPNPHRLKPWVFAVFFHPALEELELAFHIPEFPDLFHLIPKLRIANLNDSKFLSLPPSFYQLPALERLAIRDVPIPELPFELGNLRTLRYLELSQGCFSIAWARLTALAELQYYGNMLIVPGEIVTLPNLKTMCLSGVSDIREDFLNFPHLEKLFFRVSRSPANFRFTKANLPCLKELDIDDPEVFMNTLSAFQTLEKLHISGKVNEALMPAFTESLRQLINLKFILVEKTGITNLDWCSSMVNLEYLGVENNAITAIPPGLCKLQNLKTIILKRNPVTTIPELEPMPNVTFIDLDGTKIPIDPKACTDIQPVQEELDKLVRIFPNVAYFTSMKKSNT